MKQVSQSQFNAYLNERQDAVNDGFARSRSGLLVTQWLRGTTVIARQSTNEWGSVYEINEPVEELVDA